MSLPFTGVLGSVKSVAGMVVCAYFPAVPAPPAPRPGRGMFFGQPLIELVRVKEPVRTTRNDEEEILALVAMLLADDAI